MYLVSDRYQNVAVSCTTHMCIAQVEASVTVILTHHLVSFALLENIVEIAKKYFAVVSVWKHLCGGWRRLKDGGL